MAGVRLEWAQFGDFETFDILRSDSPMDVGSLPSPIATGLTTMYYVDTAVVEGSTYYYRVVVWRDEVSSISSEMKIHAGAKYWDQTTFISNFASLVDIKGNALTATGSCSITSDSNAFNSSSLQLSGGYVSAPYSSNFAFTGDFSIQLRFKFSSHANYGGILCCADSVNPWTNGWNIIFNGSSNNLRVEVNNADVVFVSATALSTNIYHEIALIRTAGVLRLFINGRIEGTANYSNTIDSLNNLLRVGIEREGNQKIVGNFDMIRIIKDVGVYDADYTPESQSFIEY